MNITNINNKIFKQSNSISNVAADTLPYSGCSQPSKCLTDKNCLKISNLVSHSAADSSSPSKCSPFKGVTQKISLTPSAYREIFLRQSKIPSESLKANYLPSFGRLKKAGNVSLTDRETGNTVTASLKKDQAGKFTSYKIFNGSQEAGYIDIISNTIFPETDYVLTEPDNVIPQVVHLCSLQGDKYSGIGTALIKTAIDESIREGKGGCLWLIAQKGYASGISNYRRNENPIPFYYKLGFKSLSPQIDKYITNCINTENYDKLPDMAVLVLSSADAKKLKSNNQT